MLQLNIILLLITLLPIFTTFSTLINKEVRYVIETTLIKKEIEQEAPLPCVGVV